MPASEPHKRLERFFAAQLLVRGWKLEGLGQHHSSLGDGERTILLWVASDGVHWLALSRPRGPWGYQGRAVEFTAQGAPSVCRITWEISLEARNEGGLIGGGPGLHRLHVVERCLRSGTFF